MTTTWFTSDTHFWHKHIIDYCNRPVPGTGWMNPSERIEAMNKWLIQRWNEKVKPNDEVWHLGDFFFCGTKKALEILQQLNGRKHWIRGNHDYGLARNKEVIALLEAPPRDYKLLMANIPYEDEEEKPQQYTQPIVLCHFPILSWDGMAHGSWHLHGHCHGSIDNSHNDSGLRMDVGVDAENNNWYPISLDEIRNRMALRTVRPVDHHSSNENNPRFNRTPQKTG
jgi:calcineurin-like phosphoesterase family protein